MNSEVKINDSLGGEEPRLFTSLTAEPITVTEQTWPKDTVPLVSICCITYNHESFIRDAIDGFLMQKTSFPIEILIYDDASTDETASIIKGYEDIYPHIMKPIYQTENQYSKGLKPSKEFNFPRAKGKYIALCEGDDYWTDPLKLQKQADFLDKNHDFVICFHDALVIYENIYKEAHSFSDILADNFRKEDFRKDELFTEDFIKCNIQSPAATASAIFRNGLIKNFPQWFSNSVSGDIPLYILLSAYGKGKYINEKMSVYRIHEGGVSSNHYGLKFYYNRIHMFRSINKYLEFKYKNLIDEIILDLYIKIAKVYIYKMIHNSRVILLPIKRAFRRIFA